MKEETIDRAIEFAQYLTDTLVPSLREDGPSATADDLEEAAETIDRLLPAAHACQGLEIPADAPAGVLAEAIGILQDLASPGINHGASRAVLAKLKIAH